MQRGGVRLIVALALLVGLALGVGVFAGQGAPAETYFDNLEVTRH
jgi:hypothetical protein